MSVLEIAESQVLKDDPYFQLKRVTTRTGEELLVKLALTDRGDEDKLLEREFQLLRDIGPDHGLISLRLARLDGRLAAVYGAFDGQPLAPPGGPLDLQDVAETACRLCGILAALHERGTLLLGVSLGSFLVNPHDRRLVLADAPFAQPRGSSVDRREAYWFESPYLAYAAPELLGGASLPLDHRADLYSLGGLLYRLIARRPLFDASDPIEVIQCHLAREPRHLGDVVPRVPRPLADAVMKLLAKSPHDRFASVEAFEQAISEHIDAVKCETTAWTRPGRKRRPSASSLSFSAGLRGHGEAVELVRGRIRSTRSVPEIVFLEGEAGIGKTTLLRETQRLESHAHFCGGAFDHSGPAGLLGGWTSALVDLANVVLTSPDRELEVWRGQFAGRLGEWAPLIAALAPEWQAILRCPAPSHEPRDTSLNRLALAIRRLISCYADDESPVVLTMDDLQWADSSSLRILELVLTAPEPLNLIVLAAVRDGDAHDAAVIQELRDRLTAARCEVAAIRLGPWTRRDIQGFLAESFEHDIADADELADLLLAKTHGNPFFVRELLRSLHLRQALCYQVAEQRWHWDKDALRHGPVTDNVVGFLSHRIAGLSAEVKDALRIAACLGGAFSLRDFSLVNEPRPVAAKLALRRAVSEGLLVERELAWQPGAVIAADAGDTRYAFVHDRVLEAARTLLSSDACSATHLRLGRLLSRDLQSADQERICKVAGHFNVAGDLIEDRQERYQAAELDLRAGRLAKRRGAFSQALDFLQAGLNFLGDPRATPAHDPWGDRFELALALHEETADVALLNGQHARTTRLCDAILTRVESPLQKVLAYEIRIAALKADKRFSDAVDAALEILRELGVEFPRRPTLAHLLVGFMTTRRRVFAGPLTRIAELPAMRDARIKAAGRIIQSVYSAAYLGRPALFPFLVYRHVADSLAHGNEEYSGVTYTAFGVVLAATARFEDATQLGLVGLGLLRQLNADRLKARAYMAYYTFIFPWQNHIRDALPFYREGLDAGLAHGDFEYASYIMTLESLGRLHTGESLGEVQPELERHLAKIKSLGQERSILLQNLLCQMAFALEHGPEGVDPRSPISGGFYDEARDLPRCLDPLDENLVFHHYLAKLTLYLFFGDHESAVEAARQGRPYVRSGGFGNYLSAVFVTYESLALLIAARRRGGRARLGRVRSNLRQLRTWARAAPMNFLHKVHLVEAERYRYLGRRERAAEHYETAIELAHKHGFVHEAGLAQELAAGFYFERGMDRLGRQYLGDCYLSYQRWGAKVVLERLRTEHAQQLAILDVEGPVRRSAPRFLESLDYRTLLKSSQAISGEIQLPRLLERLLQNILEHTGAQRAVLVLEKRGGLHVEAEADVDIDRTSAIILGHESVDDSDRLCRAIVHYSARRPAPVVLADAAREGPFVDDPYVRERRPKSVLCTPVFHQGKLIGLVYLENNRVSHVFTEARLEVVNLLAGQAAISIANARFHALELEAQQAKINPHFLFNALSSIANLAVSDGSKAETAIVKLASLYRYILTSSTGKLVTLDRELEIVRNYLMLEELRHGAKLRHRVDTEGDISRVQLPGLLIQPLVENAIRHGVEPKLTAGTVTVRAEVRGERCCIVVQDDGDGCKHGTSGTGFGLRSVQERLALAYGQRFSFAISRAGGYRVEIEIPAGG